MKWIVKVIGGTLLALVTIIIAISFMVSSCDKKAEVTKESIEKSASKIGQVVKSGDLEYTIMSVETRKELKASYLDPIKPGGGQFIVLEIKIKNTGKEKYTADTSMCKLKDTKGAEYEASCHDSYLNADNNGFFLEAINPNATKTAKVAFDCPSGSVTDYTFVGDSQMFGGSSDPAVIKLQK